MELVGSPGEEFLRKIQSDEARNYIRSLPKMEPKDFRQVFVGASENAIDLLRRMLVLDPDQRINATDALAHPYLSQFHDPDDEPVCEPIDFMFEKLELSLNEWKSKSIHLSVFARDDFFLFCFKSSCGRKSNNSAIEAWMNLCNRGQGGGCYSSEKIFVHIRIIS
ncbi:hypothetical protein D918_03797 [Trichuris suis]|nr:hypothetical protein D918_03797 [Trichuris suis]